MAGGGKSGPGLMRQWRWGEEEQARGSEENPAHLGSGGGGGRGEAMGPAQCGISFQRGGAGLLSHLGPGPLLPPPTLVLSSLLPFPHRQHVGSGLLLLPHRRGGLAPPHPLAWSPPHPLHWACVLSSPPFPLPPRRGRGEQAQTLSSRRKGGSGLGRWGTQGSIPTCSPTIILDGQLASCIYKNNVFNFRSLCFSCNC